MERQRPLMFTAGQVAATLRWRNPQPVTPDELMAISSSATEPPLLLVAETTALTLDVMRAFAGVALKRPVALVCDRPPPAELATWAPVGTIHAAADIPPPPTAVEAFMDDVEVSDELYRRMIEAPDGYSATEWTMLADMIGSTNIEPDLSTEWFMLGGDRVHTPDPQRWGWDGSDDLVQGLGAVIAIPVILDYSHVLGVGAVEGQDSDQGCYVVRGDLSTDRSSGYRDDYIGRDGRRFPVSTVSFLMNTFRPMEPDSYPSRVYDTPHGVKAMERFLEVVLLSCLRGTLKHGGVGLTSVVPHLADWITELRSLAADEMRKAART